MKKLCLFAFLLSFATITPLSAAEPVKPEVQAGVFTGRIYEAGTQSGIGELTVRLIPPRDVRKPEKVTTTDEDGKFRFTDLGGDKYLLEVYQGLTLLYREVIEGKEKTPKEIALKKK